MTETFIFVTNLVIFRTNSVTFKEKYVYKIIYLENALNVKGKSSY